jgi:hypothetical protein
LAALSEISHLVFEDFLQQPLHQRLHEIMVLHHQRFEISACPADRSFGSWLFFGFGLPGRSRTCHDPLSFATGGVCR